MTKLKLALAISLCLAALLLMAAPIVPTPSSPARSIGVALSSQAINISTATTTKIISNQGAGPVNIMQLNLLPLVADNVALVYGTKVTTECDTGTTAIIGGSTAAAGWNLAATQLLVIGDGVGVVWQVPAGKDVCLVTSAATQLSGSVSYF